MKVVSKKGCGLCITVKTMLQKKKIQYTEFAPESEEGTILLNIAKSKELPVIVLDDGSVYSGMNAYQYVKTIHTNYYPSK